MDVTLWERVLGRDIDVVKEKKLISVLRNNHEFASMTLHTCIEASLLYVPNDIANLMVSNPDPVLTAFPFARARLGEALGPLGDHARALSRRLGVEAHGDAPAASAPHMIPSDVHVESLSASVQYGPVDALVSLAERLEDLALAARARAGDAARPEAARFERGLGGARPT